MRNLIRVGSKMIVRLGAKQIVEHKHPCQLVTRCS